HDDGGPGSDEHLGTHRHHDADDDGLPDGSVRTGADSHSGAPELGDPVFGDRSDTARRCAVTAGMGDNVTSRIRWAAGVALAVLASTSAPVAGATPAQGDIERTDLAQGTTDAPVTIISVGHPTTLYVQQLEL